MSRYSKIFLISLCLIFIFTTGCTSTSQPVPSESTIEPTPIQAEDVIPEPLAPEDTPLWNLTIASNTTTPPTNQADPTDVTEINFLHYSDPDFSVDYPSTWTIKKSTFTPYYCKDVLDESRKDYHVCFENESKTIGPFLFRENDRYQKPYRYITFTSADGKLKFVSFTQDFLSNLVGNYMLKPNMDWTKAQFEARYPGLLWSTHITNYKYFQSDNLMVSSFDVNLPKGSKYYPVTYSEKAMVTVHHVCTFAFITDVEHFEKYKNLKDRMFSSIKSNDMR